MKYKHIIIVFAIAFIIDILGAFFKITHWQLGPLTGNLILFIGMIGKVVGAILLIIKLSSKKKTGTFLNQ